MSSPPIAIFCTIATCKHKRVTARLKSDECQKCDAKLPEERAQLVRHTLPTCGQAGGAILPIATSTFVAAAPPGTLDSGVPTAGKTYLAEMQQLRDFEALLDHRKQQGTDWVPKGMQKEFSRLRAIEGLADRQMPIRADASKKNAAEEAT